MLIKKTNSESPKLLNIIEELKDGFCTIDPSGEFLYLNLAAAEMLEINNNESDYNFYNHVIREKSHLIKMDEYLKKSDYFKDYELDLYTTSGIKFPVLLTMTKIKDPTGDAIGFSILIKDMTYIKKMQQQLFLV